MSRRWMAAVVVTAAMAVTLAACGSDSNKTSSGASATTTTATAASSNDNGGYYGSSNTTAAPSAATGALKTGSSKLGTVVTDDQGRTLYAFVPDSATASQCNTGCDTTWPPLTTQGTPSGGNGLDA